ncbi:MAG TPA: hypothetical protein VGC88_09105 [Terriglobales bacterium]
MPFAQKSVAEMGVLFPFAAAITLDGRLRPIAVAEGEGEPTQEGLMAQYSAMLKYFAETEQLSALALCYESFTLLGAERKMTDAICVLLEHQHGEAIKALVPFEKGEEHVQFGELSTVTRSPEFFVQEQEFAPGQQRSVRLGL